VGLSGAGGQGGSGGKAGAAGTGGAGATCGDAKKEGTEQCDGADLDGATCASITGDPGATGTVACFANCTLDGSKCQLGQGGGGAGGASACGNGAKDAAEQCDGVDLDGQTCAIFLTNPEATGELTCFTNCTLDGSKCQLGQGGTGGTCGNKTLDVGEVCDGGDLDGATCASVLKDTKATGALACFTNCTFDLSGCKPGTAGSGGAAGAPPTPACGDGIKNNNELCDKDDFGVVTCASALGVPGAGGLLACNANCTLDASGCTIPSGGEALCGNGSKEGSEQCDKADLGSATCATALGNPNATGALACFANCLLDASGCKIPPPPDVCGGQVCSEERQPCGFDCQPPCPAGNFCLTGCCTPQIR
jgi:hypothetical protein